MTLPASGQISMSDIATEFGAVAPVSISQYYRGGARVPATPQNANIPLSGQISFSQFYGAAAQIVQIPSAIGWESVGPTQRWYGFGFAASPGATGSGGTNLRYGTSNLVDQTLNTNAWILVPTHQSIEFDIRITSSIPWDTNSSKNGIWYNLDSGRLWFKDSGNAFESFGMIVELRDAATLTILDSKALTIGHSP